MSASPPGLRGGADPEGRHWALYVQGPQGQGPGWTGREEGALGTASSFELVQGELCHSGQDSLGRDACAMLRRPAPGEQPRCDFLGLAVRSCKAFPGRSQARPAGSHEPQTLQGPPGLLAFYSLVSQCLEGEDRLQDPLRMLKL